MKTTQIVTVLLLLTFTAPTLAQPAQLDWVRQFGTSGEDESLGVTIDGSGGVYITGWTHGDLDGNSNAGEYDAFLTKYDAGGNKAWTQLLGTNELDFGHAVATDSEGGVYVTGYTYGDLEGHSNTLDFDAFLTKYDTNGNKA